MEPSGGPDKDGGGGMHFHVFRVKAAGEDDSFSTSPVR